jgi:hypothetical protein
VHFIDEDKGVTVHKRGEHRKNSWGTQLLHASDQLGKGSRGREQDHGKNSQTGFDDHIP